MGRGIAQAAATCGYRTILFDPNPEVLSSAKHTIEEALKLLQQKGKISPIQSEAIAERIGYSTKITDCIADIIIEAIVEDADAKQLLFMQLDELNSSETIIASNTSSLSVTTLAKSITRPERFAGMHFFNPPAIMKLVEIVRAEKTSEQTIAQLSSMALQLGKHAVICKDAPGFIVNRVARPYYLEALRMLEQEKATVEQIDLLMESTGFKMGPFRLMDLIGNDINYGVSRQVYEALGSPDRLKPSPVQQDMVKQGLLGKKSGSGYYNY